MSTAAQPNLIYVFADQLRWQSVGLAGDEIASSSTGMVINELHKPATLRTQIFPL